ncbi:methyltransferase domain-containing protein [Conexibacter sp. W3-3-2]|nr:methyltransferase domain-containing protein [Conexibacter sp. W3-3-2]
MVLPLRPGQRDDAAADGPRLDVLRRRRPAGGRADHGLGRLAALHARRPARSGHRHAAEPDRLPVSPERTAAPGADYWRARARALGERAVISTDHPDGAALDDVTARHRAHVLPALAAELDGTERTVLDLGCGTGRLTADLAAAVGGRAIGVDPVPELLALAPASAATEFRTLDVGEALPLADDEVDVVFTLTVLGGLLHDDELDATAGEIRRVLRPGGLLLLAESVSDLPRVEHWVPRSADDYARAFPWADLRVAARFDDAGDPIAVLAGR